MKEQKSPQQKKKREISGIWVLLLLLSIMAAAMLMHTISA
jgi:paraquat-inducible protein B